MDAAQFCGEYGYETTSGRVSFSKKTMDTFIKTYTNLQPEDFTPEMRKRLRIAVMIDLYNIRAYQGQPDYPAEKIELPSFIFE